MAKCNICGREMLTAKSCIGTQCEIDGRKYKRIRFGDPEDMSARYIDFDKNVSCGDCGCHVGGFHHWGCDMEACPKCGHQLISCECENVYLLTVTKK